MMGAIPAELWYAVVVIVGAWYVWSTFRSFEGTPDPVETYVGFTAQAIFQMKRKKSGDFLYKAVRHNRPAAVTATGIAFTHAEPPNTTNGSLTVTVTGVRAGRGEVSVTVASSRRPKTYGPDPVTVIVVDRGYDPLTYPPDRWDWDTGKKWYTLIGSDSKTFVCFEYSIKKLTWDADNEDPPNTGPGMCTAETLVEKLDDAGYAPAKGSQCDCDAADNNKYCAVVYSDKDSGFLMHCAVLDWETCDWGGKLSGDGLIARFKDPRDYLLLLDKKERSKVKLTFYCLEEGREPPDYISDIDLFNKARD